MLEYEGVGYRSGISPFSGLAVSQKKRKVRSWSSRRKGSMLGLAAGGSAVRSLGSSACPVPPATRTGSATTSAIARADSLLSIVILQGVVAATIGCAPGRRGDGQAWPFFFTPAE